ncbi:hypothetical protein SAY86_008399 [Trapa natans]|uniref:MHD domain-containing protein n=1 Tax=Trapa natans TaxID=22666 RepID=A0AAN7QAL8_TRANT|nr:hypothetical protein SAY86_008399 [Trapa natans]
MDSMNYLRNDGLRLHSCQQQWTRYSNRCCWGLEDEDVIEFACEVDLTFTIKPFESGMHECKLGLNDRVLLKACVRLARFENYRTISFVQPDCAFDLMTYRLSTQVKPLIWVEAQVERHSRSRVEISVKVRNQFKERRYPETDAVVWKINSFPGGKEYMKKELLRGRHRCVKRIQVRHLKIIEKSGYQAVVPWMKKRMGPVTKQEDMSSTSGP